MTGPDIAGNAEDSQDPSMEEILASIRRILSEDEGGPGPEPAPPPSSGPEPVGDDIFDLDPAMLVVPPPHAAPPEHAPEPAPHPAHGDVAQAAAAEPMQIHPEPVAASALSPDLAPSPGLEPAAPPHPELRTPPPAMPAPPMPAAEEPMLPPPAPPASLSPAGVPPGRGAWDGRSAAPEHDALSGLVAPAAAAAAASSVGSLMRTLATERATAVHRGGPTIEELVREEIRPLLKDWLDNHLPPLVERLVRTEIERVINRTQP